MPASDTSDLTAALRAALAAGTRDAFAALLTADVLWGNESCSGRAEVSACYAGLLAAGLRIAELTESDDGHLLLTLRMAAPDPAQLTFRLTPRDGLIAAIVELGRPPRVELLYFDGCPNHETFLPHLRQLLAEHAVTAPITLIRVEDDEDARHHRFLGSPTLRVDGLDVDPGAAGRDTFGLQCRLYRTPDGTRGVPADEWILDALGDPCHHAGDR
ncbi:DF family (seleno)protein [Amycolatopsis sp. H20-H5]|uniref:DF family (seleno)protein n=1 Tax=Amycolatopsis sp. H20-H5 TaxID=3046309 RepID=UPI002DBF8C23|nr:hypothetical protein [Amycolatopsis sp. H20-H5]MEC3980491.1 hypothetical protein [Amycolatopsis sp. H20-H5]